jgi:membrane-associated protease RseP (regulator of RpoE activity)
VHILKFTAMMNASEASAITLMVLIALGILGWGFVRARPFGKLGILAWLQSVVLMVPWLLLFGLFAAGIYLNLVSILFLLVASTGLYIFLGKRLRAAGQDTILRERAVALAKAREAEAAQAVADATQAAVTDPTATQLQSDVVPLPTEDLQAIKGIFGIDTFFATETIPYQEGVIFKGNLRGEPSAVHQRLSTTLQERFPATATGAPRYRLFLVENQDGKPVVIVLPSSNDPKPTTGSQGIFALVLAIATAATCLETAGILLGFDFTNAPQRWLEVLPIGGGLIGLLAAHEIGHRVLAQRYQVRLSPPFFFPTWQLGSFGALTRFESILPNRTALFDIAFAGPAAGGLVSFVLLVTGLVLSHPGSLFQVPVDFFKGSILVGTLAKVILGSALQGPLVNVHPLTVVGWLGLVITALNLMPAGQLDGGRIVQAIYGRKTASRTTIATVTVLAIVSFLNPLALYWAIIILFLQRDLERPSLNELSEPDDARAALGLLALFLMIATLLPLTPSLAGRLGIGG